MSTNKSPLGRVKEQFGSKEKLVDALVGMPPKVLARPEDEDKDAYRTRLLSAANTKLLKLHTVGSTIISRWGSKEQLVDALLALENRSKDQDYRGKLLGLPLGRLFDQFSAAERRSKRVKKAPRKQAASGG